MKSLVERTLVVLLALVMVSSALVAIGSGSARAVGNLTQGPTLVVNGPTAPSAPAPNPALERFLQGSATEPGYWGKMSGSVRTAARTASGSMEVSIYTDEVAQLGALLRRAGVATQIGSVPSTYTGPRVVTIEVPAKLLEKIAALDHVVAIAPAVSPQVPDQADPDLPARADGGAPAPTIIEAGKGHQVPEAWALGFNGTGINVAVMDSGVDFGHPDLQGTFAREPNTASPYYNWPIAFDPNSMFLYLVAGRIFPEAPGSWYVDTSFTSTANPVNGTLNSPFNGHFYNVSGIPSLSGVYHLGLHPDNTLYAYWYGERPAVLVTDATSLGVYDTVYVDLNDDYHFADDKAANVNSPVAWADLNLDGVADVSGGMVYFIADGTDPIPYSNVTANRYGLPLPVPTAGDLVAFMIGDYLAPGGDHGTMCSSAIVAQNVTGHVLGFAPGAKLIAVGDIYAGGFSDDIYLFVAEGYDGISGTGDEAHVASASFGYSEIFNDGWDYEARFVELVSYMNIGTAFTVSTGNGGHGFGTVTSPGSSNGVIAVGASTSYNKELGAEGFEDANHSTFGDVQPWSNRGPSTLGMPKPDVVTVGAWATGDGALNSFGFSPPWTVWGGTSLSAPATAGIVALIAEAWVGNGLGVPWINFYGKLFLDDGATNIHYDPEVMGHGLANAYRSVLMASLQGGLIAMDTDTMFFPTTDWAAGDYRGTKYQSFAHIMSPGQTNTTRFEVLNANRVAGDSITISDRELRLNATQTFWVNATNSLESALDFLRPDYLLNLTPFVPAGTDLVKVTLTFPYSQFDPNGNYVRDSSWRLLLYDWKDYNGNGIYWNDTNGNGVVNTGEMDSSNGTEIMRFTYGYPTGTNIEAFVHDPLSRIHDGLLLGIQHRYRSAAVPFTNMTVTVDYYDMVDAPWLSTDITSATLAPMGGAFVTFNVTLPANQPFGTLSGMVVISNATGVEMQVPVIVNVAATGTDFAFGGDPNSTAFLDNNRVFGGIDWSWRAEAGDWRFFFTDIPDSTPINPGDTLLVHTKWENVPTDIDTLIMGPTPDPFSGVGSPWGPYIMDTVGASAYTRIRAGTWAFQTATGGPEEWVSAPLQTGLHEIALHNVNYAGLSPSELFTGEVGRFTLAPNPWVVNTANLTGTGTFATNSSLTLPGLSVLAFGVAEPVSMPNEVITQGGSWTTSFTAANIGVMDLQIGESYPQGMDIDLYLYRWTGTAYALVASSAGPTAFERIRMTMPADGTYLVLVDGFSVPAGTGYFDYFQAVVSGTNLTPTNVPTTPIPAGTPSGFDVAWSFDPAIAPWRVYLGVLFVGPKGAPAIELDALFTTYDGNAPQVLAASPSDGSFVNTQSPTVVVDYVDPQITSGIQGVRFLIDGLDLSFAGRFNATQFVWSMPFDMSQGAHRLALAVYDGAGFVTWFYWSITIDTKAPVLDVTSPDYVLTRFASAVVAGTTEPGALLTVNGAPVAVDTGGGFSTTITLASGLNTISVVSTDAAGNAATVVKTVTLDATPPAVAITAPADGSVLNTAVVHVTGTAEAGAQVTVNGIQVVLSGGSWGVDLAFADGVHSIAVTATDAAGNAATTSRSVTIDTMAPPLSVDSPTAALTNVAAQTVSGTTEAGATLSVNGNGVTVASDGTFSTSVTLVSGVNRITVVAHDAAGNSATVVRTITLDATAPVVTVTSPTDGLATNHSSVVVTGTVDDPTAMVFVNGIVVQPSSSGAWSVSLALAEGSNTIAVSAVDPAGNHATSVTRQVTYTSPVPGLQNGINNNVNTINGVSSNLVLGLVAVLVVALAAIGAVYLVLNRKIGRGVGGTKPEDKGGP